MAMAVQEIYNPQPLGANVTVTLVNGPCTFGGFIPITAGTFQLKDSAGNNLLGPVGVNILQFVFGGFACPNGAQVILTGGCSGTALYAPPLS